MDKDRRKFLEKAFKIGGISALFSLGISPAKASMIIQKFSNDGGDTTEILRPDGDTLTTNWAASSAGFYQDVSDESNSTYIYTSFQNQKIILTCADTSASAGKTITNVTIKAIIRDTAGSTVPDFYLNVGGTVYQYAMSGISGTFTEYTHSLDNSPKTGTAWTSTEINGTFVGMETANATNTTELAELWIVVTYVP